MWFPLSLHGILPGRHVTQPVLQGGRAAAEEWDPSWKVGRNHSHRTVGQLTQSQTQAGHLPAPQHLYLPNTEKAVPPKQIETGKLSVVGSERKVIDRNSSILFLKLNLLFCLGWNVEL